ncbi:MAG: hypothetical protein E7356_03815 [Clostridiales bacterium]|nr:hypothetical protein [Clostridiales bacterium]
MTQEQRVTRGSIIIFILSLILLLCLGLTATLAYFAGSQTSDMTLILGGPVRVTIKDRQDKQTTGAGNLVMNIKTGSESLLPGMGIDMQAIASITSSQMYSTSAMLRAILDIEVRNLTTTQEKEVEDMIRKAMAQCLTYREDGIRDGWVLFDDGNYYYCSKDKYFDPTTKQEFIQLAEIKTSDEGERVPFINGTFQFPTKYYTNQYAHAEIVFNLRFEAIQFHINDNEGDDIPNTIFNVKKILDEVNWDKHNN